MSIDERVEEYFEGSVNYQMAAEGIKHMARQSLKSLLLEVARDQRKACAEAIDAAHLDTRANLIDVNVACSAALHATLEAK